MKIGDKAKLIKKTFLKDGVFIFKNSIVEIEKITDSGFHIVYKDKEGFLHHIDSIKENELESV